MRNLSLKLKLFTQNEYYSGYYLEAAWVMLRSYAAPALVAAVIVLGVISGLLATKLSLDVVLLVLGGIAVLLVAFSRPEYMILLMLIASSSIYTLRQIPTIKVGFGFSAIEFGLIFLLGLIIAQLLGDTTKTYIQTPLDWPVALFFLASFVSMINSVVNLGTDIDLLEFQWRILFNYLVFFAVTNLIRNRRQLLTLVLGMFVIATVTAFLMVAQQAAGSSATILPGYVHTAGVMGDDFSGVSRIRLPGESLVLVMFMPALILFISRERMGRVGWLLFAATIFLLLAVAFTFNRRMWIGIAISIMVVFLLSTRMQRKNLLIFLGVIIVLGLVFLPLLSAFFPRAGDIFNALYIRGASLFTGDQVKYSASWQWRMLEIGFAKIKIKQHPLLGIGPGNDYRPRIRPTDTLTGHVHNNYYFLMLDLGLAGFIPFVWFSAMFLFRWYRLWHTIKDKVFMAVVLGFGLSYITVLITCIAAPAFMTWSWAPVLGVMLGINEVIYRLNRETAT